MRIAAFGKRAAPILIECLDDRSAPIGVAAADGLVEIGPSVALELALDVIESPWAAKAPGELALLKLGQRSPSVLDAIADALAFPAADEGDSDAMAFVLAMLGEPAVAVLPDWMDHESPMVRRTALVALGWVGPGHPAALPPLERAAHADDQDERMLALHGLRASGSDRVETLALLAELVHHPDERIRMAADGSLRSNAPFLLGRILPQRPDSARFVEGLARSFVAGPEHLPWLKRLLRDDRLDTETRSRVARLVGSVGPRAEELVPALLERLEAGEAAAAERAEIVRALALVDVDRLEVLDALSRRLTSTADPSPAVREMSFKALATAREPGPRGTTIWVRAFENDPSLGVRAAAGWALVRHAASSRRVADLCASTLSENQSDEIEERQLLDVSARLLGVCGVHAREHVSLLIDPEIRITFGERWSALEALGADAVPALARTLDPVDDIGVAVAAVEALERMATSGTVVAALDRARACRDVEVQSAALRALARHGHEPRAVLALAIQRLTSDAPVTSGGRAAAFEPLGEHARAALPVLIDRLLLDRDPKVRAVLARALGAIQPDAPEVQDALRSCLAEDGRPAPRAAAAEALVAAVACEPTSIAALTEALEDPDARVRSAAAEALGRARPVDEETRRTLLRCLGEKEDVEIRRGAARGLGHLGEHADARVVSRLIWSMKNDRSGFVRIDCLESIARLGPRASAAVPWLMETLHLGPWNRFRVRAAEALAAVAEDAESIPALLWAARDLPLEGAGGGAFADIQSLEEVFALERAFRLRGIHDDRPTDVRLAAIEAAVEIAPRDDRVHDALRHLARDRELRIRRRARALLDR